MELKEFKEKTKGKLLDVIANLGALTLENILTDDDIHAAKENTEELLSLINGYIEENKKSKFKVGDYIVYECIENNIVKIDSIISNKFHGIWYTQETENIKRDYWYGTRHIRLATQEEIAEYKAALTFHDHGRKPFEVKDGDVVEKSNKGRMFVSCNSLFTKHDFLSGEFKLICTREDFDKWLSDGKTDIG